MKYEISKNDGVGGIAGERERVGLMPSEMGRPVHRGRAAIKGGDSEAAPGEALTEVPTTRTEFEGNRSGRGAAAQCTYDPTRVAHDRIDAP